MNEAEQKQFDELRAKLAYAEQTAATRTEQLREAVQRAEQAEEQLKASK